MSADTETATSLTIRLSASQRDDWTRRARAEGRSLSNWIRWMIDRQIRNPNPKDT